RTERIAMSASRKRTASGTLSARAPSKSRAVPCGLLTRAGAEAYVGTAASMRERPWPKGAARARHPRPGQRTHIVPYARTFPASAARLVAGFAVALATAPALAAKATECTKIGVCYCVNDELKPEIATKVERFRALIADQRKAGKAVGYLSVPLSPAGGG